MSVKIGLANRRLQPLGHLSERCNPYAFGISGSNRGSESAESAESKHQRGGPKSGPTPTADHVVERPAEAVCAGAPGAAAVTRDSTKSGTAVVPEVVTPFERSVRTLLGAPPINPKALARYQNACDDTPVSVRRDPLLAKLRSGAR
jgi:hypothetical protein